MTDDNMVERVADAIIVRGTVDVGYSEALAIARAAIQAMPPPLRDPQKEALTRARNYVDKSKDDSGHKKWVLDALDAALK